MDIAYYVLTPFTWLLMFFYQFFNSYGIALILFALVVKLILFPLSLKGKRSMIQMNMLSGKLQKLQKQYGKDRERYNLEVQKLYEKEHVNPMGGCLWSMLPLFILLPLYAIIRQPLKYMMGMTPDQIVEVANSVLNWAQVSMDMGWVKNVADVAENALTVKTLNMGYNQLYLASLITPENLEAVKACAGETAREIFSLNFNFLGVNLSQVPHLKFWVGGISWAAIGLFLTPVVSAVTSLLFSVISMKTNNLNKQQDMSAQMQSTNRMMMFMSPLISLWIGFSMPAALSVYWVANNLLGLAQEVICSKMLAKDYARAAEAQRLAAIEEKEEEKRIRRERAEERARKAEEARKNRGKKKEKEHDDDRVSPEVRAASCVGMRTYARGRAYDPNRFGGVTTYHEEVQKQIMEKAKAAEEAAEQKKKDNNVEQIMAFEKARKEELKAKAEEEAAQAPAETESAPVEETASAAETPAAEEADKD